MVIGSFSIVHLRIKLSQMRIGVDLDGVVANFTKGWTKYYEEEFGKKILEDDIQSWGLSEPLTHFKEDLDFWKWAKDINGSSIFRNLEVYENSVETLNELSKSGHDIVIISSKPWWSIHDTLMWLGENKIPTKEIHFIEDKWTIDCEVYIDDAPYQLENYKENTVDKKIIRFVRSYNKPLDGCLLYTSPSPRD